MADLPAVFLCRQEIGNRTLTKKSFRTSPGDTSVNKVTPIGEVITDGSNADESYTDCNSCASYQTSTDLYGHEPFETFGQKVQSLLIALFPNELPVEVEHMAGGSYNRVVHGVLVRSTLSAPHRSANSSIHLLLACPRSCYSSILGIDYRHLSLMCCIWKGYI
jgi:hypothetical protein